MKAALNKPSGWMLSALLAAVILAWGLGGCVPVSVKPDLAKTSVAVWDMDDLTAGDNVRTDMGELLAAGVIEALQQEGVRVVERERLVRILEELKLGSSALTDQATRLRLGRIAGAGLMIFGGYQAVGHRVRFDFRLVNVENGRIATTATRTIDSNRPAAMIQAAQAAALELVRNY